MKPSQKFKSSAALPAYCSTSSIRKNFLSPLTRMSVLAKSKGPLKTKTTEPPAEEPPKRGHQKSITNNFGQDKQAPPPKHGRSQTICNIDFEKSFDEHKQSARVAPALAKPLLNFTKKQKAKPLFVAQPQKDFSKLAKTLKRGTSKRQIDPFYRQYFLSKSPLLFKSAKPCMKVGPEKIVINNNINIKIDYYDNKQPTPVVVSPSNARGPKDLWRRTEFSSQLKKESVPRTIQLSLSNASSPRKNGQYKNPERSNGRTNFGKLFVDLRIDCDGKTTKELPKKNVSSRNVSKSKHGKARSQLFSPTVFSPGIKPTHGTNRKSWANLVEKPTSPAAKNAKKTYFSNSKKSPKRSDSRPHHRKNALSAQPASLKACVRKLQLPIRLDENRKPALTPEPSERRFSNNSIKAADEPFIDSKMTKEHITNSSNNKNQDMSLRSFRRETNPEVAEPEEQEESAVSPKKVGGGVKISDSVVIHEERDTKQELVEVIRAFSCETGRVKPTSLDFYQIIRPLGEGSYGKVYLALSTLAGLPVAIKCYDRSKIKTETTCKRILQEIDILKSLNHPNVIRFIEIFENTKYVFLVLEYADRDDLLKYLKAHGRFTEADFLPILAQILNSLHYLHSINILHRDIKLDNILLTSKGQVKVCDFGVSRKILSKGLIHEHIGTPAYLAPEIVAEKGYSGFKADIWSLGVLTFIAFFGIAPFKGEVIEELNQNILNAEPSFPENSDLSPQMLTAIAGMLDKNPKRRLGIEQIAELLKIEIEDSAVPASRPVLSARRRATLKSLGFSEPQIHSTFQTGVINHVSALNAIFDIHQKH